jgi:hypothetical protein
MAVYSAAADSVQGTLKEFDFFGVWSPECDLPAAPGNSLREVTANDQGQVRFTESFGKEYDPNVYVVLDAKRVNSSTFILRIELNGATRQDLTMVREPGRVRTVANQRVTDGSFVVKDGMVVANGNATPWMVHCARGR